MTTTADAANDLALAFSSSQSPTQPQLIESVYTAAPQTAYLEQRAFLLGQTVSHAQHPTSSPTHARQRTPWAGHG